MSLFHDFGEFNKQTNKALVDTFSFEQTGYSPYGSSDNKLIGVRRVRTKSYSFVGMDEATAVACVNAKRAQYTYQYTNDPWGFAKAVYMNQGLGDILTNGGIILDEHVKVGADITMSKTGGDMWSVDVEVNQDDIVYVMEKYAYLGTDTAGNPIYKYASKDLNEYFAELDYDQPGYRGGYLRMKDMKISTVVSGVALECNYEYSIGNMAQATDDIAVYGSNDLSTWTSVPYVSKQKWDGKGNITITSVFPNVSALVAGTYAYYRLGSSGVYSLACSRPTSAYPAAQGAIVANRAAFEGGAWNVYADWNIPAYDNGYVVVEYSTDGGTSWATTLTNIAADASAYISPRYRLATALHEDAAYTFRVKWYTVTGAYQEIFSNTVSTPYAPERDAGTGNMFALDYALTSSSLRVKYRTTISGFDPAASANVVQWYTEGAWAEVPNTAVSRPAEAVNGGYQITYTVAASVLAAAESNRLYFRLKNGVNSTGTFAIPVAGEDGDPSVYALSATDSSVTLVTDRTAGGASFWPSVEWSADGETWTACVNAAYSTTMRANDTVTVTDTGCDYAHARWYRCTNGSAYTRAVKYPMQGALVVPYNPGGEVGTGDLFIKYGGGIDLGVGYGLDLTCYYDASAISGFDYSSADFDIEVCPANATSASDWETIGATDKRATYIAGRASDITDATASRPWFRIVYGTHRSAPIRFPLSGNSTGLRIVRLNPYSDRMNVKFSTDIASFVVANARGEYSTDCTTWTECVSFEASESGGIVSFIFKDAGCNEDTAKYYRIKYGDAVSPSVHYPIQGTL